MGSKGRDEKSGHAMVIAGYNETGFIIRKKFEKWETMVIVNIHSEWGSHWEVWTC